jgi:regulator of cell morphogenesis and NO signaling
LLEVQCGFEAFVVTRRQRAEEEIVMHHTIDNQTGILPVDQRTIKKVDVNGCCKTRRGEGHGAKPSPENPTRSLSSLSKLTVNDAMVTTARMPVKEMVNFVLRECHRPLGAALLNLETLIEVISDTHGEQRQIGMIIRKIRTRFDALRDEILNHLLEEEDILFPWIVSGNGRSAAEIIEDMKAQHRLIAMNAKTLSIQTDWLAARDPLCDGQLALDAAVKGLVDALAVHINVENHVLFTRAMRN